jgi:hypothetical protein
MRRGLFITAIVALLGASAAYVITHIIVTTSGGVNLGMDIPPLNYYNNMAFYSDIMMGTSGNFGQWDAGGAAAPVDSTGAPTVSANSGFSAVYPAVPLTLTWQGTGTVSIGSPCTGGSISNVGGVNAQTINCPQQNWGNDPNASAVYVGISAKPPVTDIHLTLPAGSSNGIFSSDLINKMAPFSTVRFMDALNSNFALDQSSINPTQYWSQRTWPLSGSRFQQQGMAYEDIIAFANLTGKAIWINIPILATDDYVCRLARLLFYGEPGDMSDSPCSTTAAGSGTETPLNSNITVYVELANEIWNSSFPAHEQLYCWANGAPEAGHTCPASTTPTSALGALALASAPWTGGFSGDPGGKGSTYGMLLTKRNHDIFAAVFGSRASQIKTIYNAQGGNTGYYPPYFNFMQTNYGAVNGYIPVLAIAPYMVLTNNSDLASLDQIFADLNANLTNPSGMPAYLTAALATAQTYGMSLIGYESGQSLTGNTTTVCTAQVDPRMYTLYLSYYNLWAQKIGSTSVINHYAFVGSCSFFGQWGAMITQADGCSQKWAALMNLAGGPACTP